MYQDQLTQIDPDTAVLVAYGSKHHAFKADSRQLVPQMAADGERFQAVFFDPPYTSPSLRGGGRRRFDDFPTLTAEQAEPIVQAIASMMWSDRSPLVFIFSTSPASTPVREAYKAMIERHFKPALRGCWQKTYKNGEPVKFRDKLMPVEEIIIYTLSGQTYEPATEWLGDDFRLCGPRGKWLNTYPTEKPEWLLRQLLTKAAAREHSYWRYYTQVLDPFAGSGSTMRACKDLDFDSVSIDCQHLIDLRHEE